MRRAWVVAGVVAFSACDFLPGAGGGTGGGGSMMATFEKGFVFVRHDDKNVYASDNRDLMVKTKLTTEGGSKHVSLSKDGKRVVFVRTTATDSELDSVSVNGGMVSQVLLASSTAARNLRNPVFNPDASKIYFAYDDSAGSSIGVVDATGAGFQRLAGGGALSYTGISMFADGSALVAAAGNSTSQLTQIEKISVLTGTGTNLRNGLGNEATGIVSRVAVSPDGTKVAFDGRVSSGSVRIFVMDIGTKVVTQLTDYPGEPGANDAFPCWVGLTDVGFSSDTGGSENIYALPAGGLKTSGGIQVGGGAEPWFGPN